MKKLLLPLCFLITALYPALSQAQVTQPTFVRSIEGVKEYKLPNGLQILLVPDATQNNVVVNITYHVGSRQEGYGETGMAHLLEHMMFKGSKKFSSIKQTIADKGAMANGTTWYDRTNYYEILPATDSNLTWALDMESDRMVNSLMRNEDLQKEFSVVRNEFESDENQPDRILMERVVSAMYLWHNYGKSTIGSKEDIEHVPIDNLKAFYKKYYQPDNATLVVAGKFDEQKVLGWIAQYFSLIPKPSRVISAPYTVEPAQDGERYTELRRNGDMQTIAIGYHTPAFADKDYVANDAIIDILTNDPSGIFYKALVETKMATDISGYSFQLHDPGFTYFSCNVPMNKGLDSVKSAFLAIADKLPAMTITQEQLDRAKNALIKQVSNLQNNTISFAIDLSEMIGAGDWRLFYLYRDRVEQLTLPEVQAALAKYYLPSNRTVGVFIPDKNAEKERVTVAPVPDIEALIKNYKGKEVTTQTESFESSIENIKKHTEYGKLSNGMQYALLKKPVKGDKVYAQMILEMGNETNLNGKDNIAMLTARMLKNGTATRSKKEINDLLDKIKTDIGISGSADNVYISLSSDKDHINEALDLLADILLHPSFNKDEFDKMMIEIKSEYEANKSDPQYIAFNTVSKKTSLYPKGHPYYPQSIEESLEDFSKITLDDLRNFYTGYYGANHGEASFAGNIDNAAIKSFLEKNLGSFNSKADYAEIANQNFDVPGSTEVVQISDKKNATCAGAINIPIKETDNDYAALDMANELLGGGAFLSSRIPQRLRESEGMSYGAGSYFYAPYKYRAGTWGVYAIFNPMYKDKLDAALREEINKALQSGFTEDELKKSVASWLQQRQTYLGLDRQLVSMLTQYMKDGKDLSFYTDYENKVKALKLSEVNTALKKYISPDKITLIYAGDFNKK